MQSSCSPPSPSHARPGAQRRKRWSFRKGGGEQGRPQTAPPLAVRVRLQGGRWSVRPLFTHLQGQHLCVKSKPRAVLQGLPSGHAELTELLELGNMEGCVPFHLLQARRHPGHFLADHQDFTTSFSGSTASPRCGSSYIRPPLLWCTHVSGPCTAVGSNCSVSLYEGFSIFNLSGHRLLGGSLQNHGPSFPSKCIYIYR